MPGLEAALRGLRTSEAADEEVALEAKLPAGERPSPDPG